MGQGSGDEQGAATRSDGARRPPAPRRPPLIRSGVLSYATQIVNAGLSFLNVLVIARALGPEGRGSVAFLTTVASIAYQTFLLGVPIACSNFGGRRPELLARLLTASLVLSAATGASAILATVGLFAAVPNATAGAMPLDLAIVLLSLPFLSLQAALLALVSSQYRFGAMSVGIFLPSLANVVVNTTLALTGVLSVRAAVAVWVSGQVLTTALLFVVAVRLAGGLGRPDLALWRAMLAFGLRGHVGWVLMLASFRVDQWILAALSGRRELGLYSIAVAWFEALFFLPTALAFVQRPDLVRASRADAARQASLVFRLAILATSVLGLLLFLLAPPLCTRVFGPAFAGSIDDLRLLVPGALGIVASKLLGDALSAQRMPGLESIAAAAAFVTMVTLDVVLIPQLGGTGAAIASTCGYLSGGLVAAYLFCHKLGARPAALLPRPQDLVLLAQVVRAQLTRPSLPGTASR